MASSSRGIQLGNAWFQRKINLRPQHRGVHLVTEEVLRQIPELHNFSVGMFHIQILHTSASLALNESWDPDVRDDMEMMLNKLVPEALVWERKKKDALSIQRRFLDCESYSRNVIGFSFNSEKNEMLSEKRHVGFRENDDGQGSDADYFYAEAQKFTEPRQRKLITRTSGLPYKHSCEGPDDMPAHVKACLLGSSLSIPISEGKLNLGTWQGIWLCEHRNHAGSRKLVVTLNGALIPGTPISAASSTQQTHGHPHSSHSQHSHSHHSHSHSHS